MRISLIVYTLNEIDGMRQIMPRVDKSWCDEIIVIDGGSTDGTVEYCREMGYPIYQQTYPRWAGAYMEAYKRATGDVLIDFSPDGNSIPELIPEMIQKFKEGYDIVYASRYVGGAKSEDDSLLTRIGNRVFTHMINILFGGNITDSLVVYRAYTRSFLEKAGLLNCVFPQCVTALISVRCGKIKAKKFDIPGDEPPRIGGVPKMNPLLDGLRILQVIARELIFYDFKKHPLKATGAI